MARVFPPLLVAVAATAAAWPILGNYFYADDFAALVEFANHGLSDALLAPAAGHMCMVRNAVFYLSFRTLGMQPTGYFATALATHVGNVLLLFALIRRVTGSTPLAFLGAALFASSPANTGTLGWYSVYGHALGTTFALVAILLVAPRPDDPPDLGTASAVGAAGCMLAASQCFGTAAAAAAIFPLLAMMLRPAAFRRFGSAAPLIAIPVIVAISWLLINGYRTRLNPAGTEGVASWIVLASDWRRVLSMTAHLFALGVVSLLLGPLYPLSRYPDPISTGVAVVFIVAVAASLAARGSRIRAVVAFLMAALACYGAVAAGRAALYASMVPETLMQILATSTRYQYLGQACLSVALCAVLADTGRRLETVPYRLLLYAWGAWAAVSGALLQAPVDHFAEGRAPVAAAWEQILREIREAPPGSTVCLPVKPVPLAIGFPGSLGVFMLMSPTDDVEGRQVRFVSSNPSLLARRDEGGRMQRLLLSDDECARRRARVGDG